MDDRTMDQLAAYVADTLDDDGRREFEARLAAEEQLRQHLEWMRIMAAGIRNFAAAPVDEEGIRKSLERVRRERAAATPRRSWVVGLQALLTPPGWMHARGVALAGIAIICAQIAVIGHLMVERDDYSTVRASATKPPPVGPFVRVSFRPDAQEKDMRFLIVGLGGTIVGGPTQLGDYYLFFSASKTDWAAQQLRQSQIIDTASVIATLPAVKE